jgi:hypothetical protein
LEAFIESHGLLCGGAAELGEDCETFLEDAFNGRARLKGTGVCPCQLNFSVKKLDSAVAWENVIFDFR